MGRRPVIGITATAGPDPRDNGHVRFFVNRQYADCVAAAGGVPIVLTEATPVKDALTLIDGLLVPGGDDIDARHFGQETHPKAVLGDDGRFLYEKRLYDAMPPNLPFLGICYGCQALNVFRGGDLIQHIPDDAEKTEHTGGVIQEYAVDQHSLLSKILGAGAAKGASYHHQANGRLGKNLVVSAKSSDGTIEAIEDATGRWIVGIQWHPERTPTEPSSVRIFERFVIECASYLAGK